MVTAYQFTLEQCKRRGFRLLLPQYIELTKSKKERIIVKQEASNKRKREKRPGNKARDCSLSQMRKQSQCFDEILQCF